VKSKKRESNKTIKIPQIKLLNFLRPIFACKKRREKLFTKRKERVRLLRMTEKRLRARATSKTLPLSGRKKREPDKERIYPRDQREDRIKLRQKQTTQPQGGSFVASLRKKEGAKSEMICPRGRSLTSGGNSHNHLGKK